MKMKDYYEILGVGRDATPEQIKAAYRRCAMKHHPDRNPGDQEAEARFKECQKAYDVLGNEAKRRAYDRGGQGGVDFGDAFSSTGDPNLDDLFSSIFSGFAGPRGPITAGEDIQLQVVMDLEDAIRGGKHKISYSCRAKCEPCTGSGSKSGKRTTCGKCQGRGQVQVQRGFFVMSHTCDACAGAGTLADDPCSDCHGTGEQIKKRDLEIQIPPGVDHGDRMRISGYGHAGSPNGDLYLLIKVRKHPTLERDGLDLYANIEVRISQAALGAIVGVDTPYGRLEVKVPEGTQSGKLLRLKGKGVKTDKGTGDLYCRINVQTPTKLSRQQRKLLEELEKSFKK